MNTEDLADGSVTSDKIADEAVTEEKVAPVLLSSLVTEAELAGSRNVVVTSADPLTVPAGTRQALVIPIPSVGTTDLVTVSPPAALAGDLLLVGWDVLIDGQVTVYLYNASSEAITTGFEPWTIRYLDLTL